MAKNNKNKNLQNNDAEFAQEVAANNNQQQSAQNNQNNQNNQFENANENSQQQ